MGFAGWQKRGWFDHDGRGQQPEPDGSQDGSTPEGPNTDTDL